MKPLEIRPLAFEDFPDWLPLWNQNNLGKIDEAVTATTWTRLSESGGQIRGLGAWVDGHMAAILHYVIHPTTGYIKPVCYMQDLYVDPRFRRRGIAKKLVKALGETGSKEGWARIYWLAESKNEEAQALYRHIGFKLDFMLHVLPL